MKTSLQEQLNDVLQKAAQKKEAEKAKLDQAKLGYADMKSTAQQVDFIAKHLGLSSKE